MKNNNDFGQVFEKIRKVRIKEVDFDYLYKKKKEVRLRKQKKVKYASREQDL